MKEIHDVIVVGSGATGGWAALELSRAGLSVVVLEAGCALEPNRDFSNAWHYGGDPTREQISGFSEAQLRQPVQAMHGAYGPSNFHLFADDKKQTYSDPADRRYYWIRSGKEGGRSLLWRGQTWRISDLEFAGLGKGEDYEGSWPLKYSDLEPYYTRVERFLRVRGTSERIVSVPDGAFLDPYPLAEEEIRFKSVTEARWRNVRAIPVRAQVQDRGIRYRGFDQWPRLSSPGSTLSLALLTGRVSLIHDAQVQCVETNSRGSHASGVHYIDRGSKKAHQVFARAIILCASTIETIRILLNSKSRAHPTGLGNSSRVLGHYFMDKIGSSLTAVTCKHHGEMTDRINVLGPYGLYLPRISEHFREVDRQVLPFGIWMVTQDGSAAPEYNLSSKDIIVKMMAFGEMAPRRENRIVLEPGLLDEWGQMSIRIECQRNNNDEQLIAAQLDVMRMLARNAGYQILSEAAIPAGLVAHDVGGVRMGTSSATSIVNDLGQCWEVPNVFVCDGASWPSNPFQNPTLTMMALASRTCRFIVNCFLKGASSNMLRSNGRNESLL